MISQTVKMTDNTYFSIWCFNFERQLNILHRHYEMFNRIRIHYMDFRIMIYEEFPELIDYSQN